MWSAYLNQLEGLVSERECKNSETRCQAFLLGNRIFILASQEFLSSFWNMVQKKTTDRSKNKFDKKRERVRKYCSDTRLSLILKFIEPSVVYIIIILNAQVRLFIGYWNLRSWLCKALTTSVKSTKSLRNTAPYFVVQACNTLHHTIASNICLIILYWHFAVGCLFSHKQLLVSNKFTRVNFHHKKINWLIEHLSPLWITLARG